jgi:hypothetical protein
MLLTVQLRLKVRRPTSWAQVAATCVLMLLPCRVVAVLERKARRCFLATCALQRRQLALSASKTGYGAAADARPQP